MNKKTTSTTIYDIATKASVSAATVSNVLNNKGNVSDQTRELILRIAKETNYSPNVAARYLKTMRTNQIMLLIPNVNDLFFLDIIQEVQLIVKEKGYFLTINSSDNDENEELRVISSLKNGLIDGLILISLNYTDKHNEALKKLNIPVVLCTIGSNATYEFEPICDYIGVDTKKGIYLAMKHLLDQHHTLIGYAGMSTDSKTGMERYQGYVSAMEEFNLPIRNELVMTGIPLEEFGYRVGMEVTRLKERPTAICAAADIVVIGLYKAFSQCEIRVPDDIAVIGMDDIYIANLLKPTISSVNLAQRDMGKECAEILIRRINGDESLFKNIVFQPKLIIRESSIK